MSNDRALSILASPTPPRLAVARDAPAPRPRPRIWSLLWAASARMRNRCVLMAGSIAGFMCLATGHPWIALTFATTGMTTYGVLVLRDLFNPMLIHEVHGLPRLGEDTEDTLRHSLEVHIVVDAVQPEDHRRLFRAIITTHEGIRAHLNSVNSMARTTLLETYRRCTEMAQMAEALTVRGHTLNDYLSTHRLETAEVEARALESLTVKSRDVKTREAFASAAKTKRDHMATYGEVQILRDRIKAQLAVIEASLQLVETRLVKLAACDADIEQTASATVEELSELLSHEIIDLLSSVEAVSESL